MMNATTRKLTKSQVREARTLFAKRQRLLIQLRALPTALEMAAQLGISRRSLYVMCYQRTTYKEIGR